MELYKYSIKLNFCLVLWNVYLFFFVNYSIKALDLQYNICFPPFL